MKRGSDHYVTIYTRKGSCRYQVQITVPVKLRESMLHNPALRKIGFKPDKRGRIRITMHRLPLAEVRKRAELWESMMVQVECEALDRTFGQAVKLAVERSRR
jgi:hypothetical protein